MSHEWVTLWSSDSPEADHDGRRVILIERLLSVYDPWYALGVPNTEAFRIAAHTVASEPYQHVAVRCPAYHPGRVAHFLRAPEEITAIEVDNEFPGGSIASAKVVLTDGHHRLIAAFYHGWKTIEAEYGGVVDIADWLCGHGGAAPQ